MVWITFEGIVSWIMVEVVVFMLYTGRGEGHDVRMVNVCRDRSKCVEKDDRRRKGLACVELNLMTLWWVPLKALMNLSCCTRRWCSEKKVRSARRGKVGWWETITKGVKGFCASSVSLSYWKITIWVLVRIKTRFGPGGRSGNDEIWVFRPMYWVSQTSKTGKFKKKMKD